MTHRDAVRTPPGGGLVSPHGATLCDMRSLDGRMPEPEALAERWPSWHLTPRQTCDLELLVNGAFSPLCGFMSRPDYESVCADMRLQDGTLWPIPVVLDVTEEIASALRAGGRLALRDAEGTMLAALRVSDVWQADRQAEAAQVYGSTSAEHAGVAHLLNRTHPFYVGGTIEAGILPVHHDFRWLRRTPSELRAEFTRRGWSRVIAFQTRNPLHRAHFELTSRAAAEANAHLLVHPVVGMTKPGDVDHYTRVRCYQSVMGRYPEGAAMLSLLPLAMRMGGPREALLHAIVRKNYGCSHLIVGRDHAGPGVDRLGKPFYGPYEAQDLLRRHEAELGVTMVPFRNMVYAKELDRYFPDDQVPAGASVLELSGTELRGLLMSGQPIPEWFSFPEVAHELTSAHPPASRRGFTVFFTGLSGAGKSTIAKVLVDRLLECGRRVSLLDGDEVRRHLSSELGFSKEHRDLNIRRIGFVASEITRHGGTALCAAIAPYDAVRKDVRQMIEPHGGFILVHVATSLEVCESRDRKGLYAKARAGILQQFTGISDPYEAPADAEVVVEGSTTTPDAAAEEILKILVARGLVDPPSGARVGGS